MRVLPFVFPVFRLSPGVFCTSL